MLTTIIYRSHICDNVSIKSLESMVAEANVKNSQENVSGILLFNGTHFFQLLEGPEEKVEEIYRRICADPRHHNLVELLRDHGPMRRFGKIGMELFDLREFDRDEVLQAVLDKGTTKYQLTYDDRALHFFRTFVEATEKENYYEIPAAESWEFVIEDAACYPETPLQEAECSFAFQPVIDPFAKEVVSYEALLRTTSGDSPAVYFDGLSREEIYWTDLHSKRIAFAMAGLLHLRGRTLSINLLPMTLVNVPNAVEFLLAEIEASGLILSKLLWNLPKAKPFPVLMNSPIPYVSSSLREFAWLSIILAPGLPGCCCWLSFSRTASRLIASWSKISISTAQNRQSFRRLLNAVIPWKSPFLRWVSSRRRSGCGWSQRGLRISREIYLPVRVWEAFRR